jgi:hypothetical protein
MVYIGKKLGIYSTNDLSLLFSINIDINIDIISPIIILKNGNILLITTENKNNNKKENLITIINSKTFKIEQKIPLFLSKDIFSLIELSNGDNAYTNEIGLVIYTKKNGKYIFSKLIPYARGILKQINEDSFLSLGQMIIKFSIEDYSVIGATTTTSAIAGRKGIEVLDGYDWLIIDEVSKCPITEVLRYLPYVIEAFYIIVFSIQNV